MANCSNILRRFKSNSSGLKLSIKSSNSASKLWPADRPVLFASPPDIGVKISITNFKYHFADALDIAERHGTAEAGMLGPNKGVSGNLADREIASLQRLLQWPHLATEHNRLRSLRPGRLLYNMRLRGHLYLNMYPSLAEGHGALHSRWPAASIVHGSLRYSAAPET